MKTKVLNQLKEKAIWFVFVILFIGFAIANERFLTMNNMFTIARQVSMYGIAAIGMTFVILIAGIDLSYPPTNFLALYVPPVQKWVSR